MSDVVVGYLQCQISHKLRTLRSWANKVHFPPENIVDLGELIDTKEPYPPARPGNPMVIVLGPHSAVFFSILVHGTTFPDMKDASAFSYSFLLKEYRSRRIKTYCQGGKCYHRKGDQEEQAGNPEVDESLDLLHILFRQQIETGGKNEPSVPDVFNRDPVLESLIYCGHIQDGKALEPQLQEAAHEFMRTFLSNGQDGCFGTFLGSYLR